VAARQRGKSEEENYPQITQIYADSFGGLWRGISLVVCCCGSDDGASVGFLCGWSVVGGSASGLPAEYCSSPESRRAEDVGFKNGMIVLLVLDDIYYNIVIFIKHPTLEIGHILKWVFGIFVGGDELRQVFGQEGIPVDCHSCCG